MRISRASPTDTPPEVTKKARTKIDTRRHELIQKMRALNPELAELVTVAPPNLAGVQGSLAPGTTLVAYHELESGLVAFVVTNTSLKVHRLPRVHATVSPFTQPGSDLDATSRALYDQLIAPLGLTGTRLVIVPHGALHYIPFSALHSGKAYLGERFALVRAPSAEAYRLLKARRAKPRTGLVAFADPAGYLGRLPGAAAEVAAIRPLFEQAQVFADDDATESRLRSLRQPPAVLHFACHGVYNPDAPELSHLALAEGRLECHEIYGLDLSGTRLVVLSACQSGTGALSGGDEVVGLARAFLLSGARHVVATLWNVDDAATKALMIAFYDELVNGKRDPADALRRAQARVRKNPKHAHPYYWAAFQLHGG